MQQSLVEAASSVKRVESVTVQTVQCTPPEAAQNPMVIITLLMKDMTQTVLQASVKALQTAVQECETLACLDPRWGAPVPLTSEEHKALTAEDAVRKPETVSKQASSCTLAPAVIMLWPAAVPGAYPVARIHCGAEQLFHQLRS